MSTPSKMPYHVLAAFGSLSYKVDSREGEWVDVDRAPGSPEANMGSEANNVAKVLFRYRIECKQWNKNKTATCTATWDQTAYKDPLVDVQGQELEVRLEAGKPTYAYTGDIAQAQRLPLANLPDSIHDSISDAFPPDNAQEQCHWPHGQSHTLYKRTPPHMRVPLHMKTASVPAQAQAAVSSSPQHPAAASAEKARLKKARDDKIKQDTLKKMAAVEQEGEAEVAAIQREADAKIAKRRAETKAEKARLRAEAEEKMALPFE